MKLHSHIARYIRRCGYALAFTLAAGTLTHAANETEVTIDYLTDAIPWEVVNAAHQYTLDMDLSKPAIPAGTTMWDTTAILDAVQNGNGAVRHWAPFRKPDGGGANWDYGIITPSINDHYVQDVIKDCTMVVKDALRQPIQLSINRKLISYVAAASLRPWSEERAPLNYKLDSEGTPQEALDNVYKHEEGIKFYDKDGNEKKLWAVYDENGRLAYHYDDKDNATLYDKDGNAITATSDVIYASPVGDGSSGSRPYIIATDEKIDVHHNKLIIDHSGFGLASAAYSQYGDVHDNVVYIHDVRCSDDIMAAGAYRGEGYANTLVLVRSEAIGHNVTQAAKDAGAYLSKYNNSGKAVGAWLGGRTENHAYDNRVFIYGSTIYQDVTGAMGGGDMYDNTVFINKSEISIGLHDVEPSRAGYSYYGKAYNNTFVLDDSIDAIAAGIIEEDMSYYEQAGTQATSSVPTVSTLHDDVVGGTAEATRGDDAAHHNRVIMTGITAVDEDTGEEVTTTVQGNIFGAVATNGFGRTDVPGLAGSATNNTVSISGMNIIRDVTVSVLTDPHNNGWTPQKLSINVGCVTGGFSGATPNLKWTPGNANNNVVVMRDSYFENSIYGGRNNSWWCISKKDAEGKEVGNGHASNNVVVLENLRTPVHDDKDVNAASSHDTTVYGGWAEGGKTNNNQVFISGTTNTMDNTMLHGGWGHTAQTNENGEILDKNGNVLLSGAHYFDGTTFYTQEGLHAGSYRRAELVNNQSGSVILSGLSGFDGKIFYDEDGNDARILASTSLAVKSGSDWVDYLRYTREIKGQVDANGALISCEFYVEGSEQPVAWFKDGSIVNNDGVTLLSGISQTALLENLSEDGKVTRARFYDKDGKVIGTIGSFMTERTYNSLKSEPPFHYVTVENDLPVAFSGKVTENADGTVTLHGEDPAVSYTFTNSAILDANDNVVQEIKSYKYIYQDGTVLHLANNAFSLFSQLDGYDEYDTYTRDNWLHVDGFQGKLKGFDHFEKLHFVFKKETDITKPLITITGDPSETGLTIVKEEGGDPVPVEVSVDISEIADQLKPGDVIPVIGHEDQSEIAGLDELPEDVVDAKQKHRRGVTSTFTLDTEFKEWTGGEFDNFGVIEVMDIHEEATPEAKALVEGRIAMLTLNNMGGNLVAEQGIDSACRALEGTGAPGTESDVIAVDQNGKGGVTYKSKDELEPGNRLFFAMNGAHNKVDSGSDVDVDGTNAIVGVARGLLAKRALTIGAFMETGWGKYHTHNNFGTGANVPTVRGTGETSYVGAGALLRYHLRHLDQQLEGLSLDASLRAGRQETDYSTADLMAADGSFASYEHESDYIAGHVGLNYTFAPADKLAATLYARYLWTHISNDEGVVCGETVNFEDMSSNRFRFGGRLTWQASEKWSPYVGMAYEWECSGTARAATYGAGITAPSMRGGSFIGEIGAVWQPSLSLPLWIEAALQGSVGKNENYGAKIGISIGF